MNLKISSAQSMTDLCRIVSRYESCDTFLKAVEKEFISSESLYKKLWYGIVLEDFSTIRRISYKYWNFFRHVFQIYHRMRGIQNPDAYYQANGGAYFTFYSATKYLDCESTTTSLLRFAEEFYHYLSFYKDLYESFPDEKSKDVMFHVLKGRLTLNGAEYHAVQDPVKLQYLDTEVVSLQDEVFCDVGAYIGDTAELLMNQYGNRIKKLYLYEPNGNNCAAARKAMEKYRNSQTEIVIRPSGVSNINQTSYITDSQSGSQINHDAVGEQISLVTLDSDILEKITFIKMDIEGSELAALQGSRNHIVREHPTLAICVYHQVEDIRNIVDWIRTQVPEYRFYLRHYSNRFAETVLYCIIPD